MRLPLPALSTLTRWLRPSPTPASPPADDDQADDDDDDDDEDDDDDTDGEIDSEAVTAIAAVLAALSAPAVSAADEPWRAPSVPPRERRDRADMVRMCRWALSRALAVPLPD